MRFKNASCVVVDSIQYKVGKQQFKKEKIPVLSTISKKGMGKYVDTSFIYDSLGTTTSLRGKIS